MSLLLKVSNIASSGLSAGDRFFRRDYPGAGRSGPNGHQVPEHRDLLEEGEALEASNLRAQQM